MQNQRPFFIDQNFLDDPYAHVPASDSFWGLVRPACNVDGWTEERKAAEAWTDVTCPDCLHLKSQDDANETWGPWDRTTQWLQGPIALENSQSND